MMIVLLALSVAYSTAMAAGVGIAFNNVVLAAILGGLPFLTIELVDPTSAFDVNTTPPSQLGFRALLLGILVGMGCIAGALTDDPILAAILPAAGSVIAILAEALVQRARRATPAA
jgi:ABC-type transport system involved in cytochrome c biogenesis permease subunit